MAVLTDNDRREAWAKLMRRMSEDRVSIGLDKPDLRAAIDAADEWVSAAQGSFNNALPTAAQSNLTAAQKALVLLYVVSERFLKGV